MNKEPSEFAFFKHIELDTELKEITTLLDENSIEYEVSSADVIIDRVIVGDGLFSKYTLKLYPNAFKRAHELIRDFNLKKDLRIEDFEHLTELSNKELFDILENPSEWSSESEVIAKKILESRDVTVSEEDIAQRKNKKLQEARNGKQVPLAQQIVYFVAMILGFYFGIILILAGIGMGYYYAYGKTTDSEGVRHYVYDQKARTIGSYIFYTGLVCLTIMAIMLLLLPLAY